MPLEYAPREVKKLLETQVAEAFPHTAEAERAWLSEKLYSVLRQESRVGAFIAFIVEGKKWVLSTTKGSLISADEFTSWEIIEPNVGPTTGRNRAGHYLPPPDDHRCR